MPRGLGTTQKKIVVFLLGGIALGLSGSPSRYFKILKEMRKEWREIDRQALKKAVTALYRSKLVDAHPGADGTWVLTLTDNGKRRALAYNIESMQIVRPEQWDYKWRLVIFDIPERIKKVRESMRYHLRMLGFQELQRSVFVYPFDGRDQIDYLVEFYDIRKHVRTIIAEHIDNEFDLKQQFGLL